MFQNRLNQQNPNFGNIGQLLQRLGQGQPWQRQAQQPPMMGNRLNQQNPNYGPGFANQPFMGGQMPNIPMMQNQPMMNQVQNQPMMQSQPIMQNQPMMQNPSGGEMQSQPIINNRQQFPMMNIMRGSPWSK